jgi:Domain of unknown function (DUF4396)
MSDSLVAMAWISLALAALSVVAVVLDPRCHPQDMWIMNVVWPLSALYAGPLGAWAYFWLGRQASDERVRTARSRDETPPHKHKPFWRSVAIGATHCGSGCTPGDIVAEWLAFFLPVTFFGSEVFGTWALDYVLAFLFGIAFLYFTIRPARDLSLTGRLKAALKADALSLTAWQIGMYGWMAVALFVIFDPAPGKLGPVFWFMMQLAMIACFQTSYPVNWWLIRRGIKERM